MKTADREKSELYETTLRVGYSASAVEVSRRKGHAIIEPFENVWLTWQILSDGLPGWGRLKQESNTDAEK